MESNDPEIPISKKFERLLKYFFYIIIKKLVFISGPVIIFSFVIFYICEFFKAEGITESLYPFIVVLGVIIYTIFVALQFYEYIKRKKWKTSQED